MGFFKFFETFSKDSAEFWLHFSEAGLLVFALILVIGLVGEYAKPSRTKMFELFVIAGVLGELLFDGGIFGFSGRLQIIQDELVEQANTLASQAVERAGNAYERASDANLKAAALEFAVEELKKENFKLAQSMRRRGVSADQTKIVRGQLKGRGHTVIVVRLDDAEAQLYAYDVYVLMANAGYNVSVQDLGKTSPYVGVIVCENTGEDLKIFRVLKEAKIATDFARLKGNDRPEACEIPRYLFGGNDPITKIFVGQRPIQ